jgi:hypothetical protein
MYRGKLGGAGGMILTGLDSATGAVCADGCEAETGAGVGLT